MSQPSRETQPDAKISSDSHSDGPQHWSEVYSLRETALAALSLPLDDTATESHARPHNRSDVRPRSNISSLLNESPTPYPALRHQKDPNLTFGAVDADRRNPGVMNSGVEPAAKHTDKLAMRMTRSETHDSAAASSRGSDKGCSQGVAAGISSALQAISLETRSPSDPGEEEALPSGAMLPTLTSAEVANDKIPRYPIPARKERRPSKRWATALLTVPRVPASESAMPIDGPREGECAVMLSSGRCSASGFSRTPSRRLHICPAHWDDGQELATLYKQFMKAKDREAARCVAKRYNWLYGRNQTAFANASTSSRAKADEVLYEDTPPSELHDIQSAEQSLQVSSVCEAAIKGCVCPLSLLS